MEVQAGEGQQHATEVWHGDFLGSAQDVLGKGLKQGQVEPLEDGEGLGAAGHFARCEAGHVGQPYSSQALEHLGLVEVKFAIGIAQVQEDAFDQGEGLLDRWEELAHSKGTDCWF